MTATAKTGLMLDFGCGNSKVGPEFIGVDIYSPTADIKADIRSVIPGLPNGCARLVVCRHVLEHLGVDQWRDVMIEMARVLEPGGTFEIRVPHPSNDSAMIHGHIHVLTPSFWADMRDHGWLGDILKIDSIDLVPDEECVRYYGGKVFAELAKFLRNAYVETIVKGHKPTK